MAARPKKHRDMECEYHYSFVYMVHYSSGRRSGRRINTTGELPCRPSCILLMMLWATKAP